MLFYLPGEVEGVPLDPPPKLSKAVRMARNCMDCQEFDRAAFFLSRDAEQNNLTVFLRFYARYLACLLILLSTKELSESLFPGRRKETFG